MSASKPGNATALKLRATAIGKTRAVRTDALGRITVMVVEDDHQFRGCRQSCVFGEIDECPFESDDNWCCVGNDGKHVSGKCVWFKRVELTSGSAPVKTTAKVATAIATRKM